MQPRTRMNPSAAQQDLRWRLNQFITNPLQEGTQANLTTGLLEYRKAALAGHFGPAVTPPPPECHTLIAQLGRALAKFNEAPSAGHLADIGRLMQEYFEGVRTHRFPAAQIHD